MSIPAATPDEVHRSRSCTHLACGTHSTSRPNPDAQAKDLLFDVARYPSRSPAAARTADPVHTEATTGALSAPGPKT